MKNIKYLLIPFALFLFSVLYHVYMVNADYGQESINIGFNCICVTGTGLFVAVYVFIKNIISTRNHEKDNK